MFLEKENPFSFLKNENRSILDLTHHPLTVVGSVPGDFIDWATAVVSEGDTLTHVISLSTSPTTVVAHPTNFDGKQFWLTWKKYSSRNF